MPFRFCIRAIVPSRAAWVNVFEVQSASASGIAIQDQPAVALKLVATSQRGPLEGLPVLLVGSRLRGLYGLVKILPHEPLVPFRYTMQALTRCG